MHPLTRALPADAILMHIGPHKTGTTAIQAQLASAREEMLELGVTYPGPRGAHHTEARALVDRPEGFIRDLAPLKDKTWRRLVRKAKRAEGRVVLSSEFFAWGKAEHRARLAEDLDTERIHLLIAARNPGALALSNWQQVLRAGYTGTLDTWLKVHYRRDLPGENKNEFWSWADAATLVDSWSEIIDPSRIHVMAIDENNRGLVPAAFEQLLGLPEGLIANQPPEAHNRSLTAPEAELLRATSVLIKDDLSWPEFSLFFRKGFAKQLLYTRTPAADEARSALPPWAAEQAAVEAESIITRLRESGVEIIGDVESLRKVPATAEPLSIDTVPIELATHALAGVMTAGQRKIRGLEARLEAMAEELAARRDPDEISAQELAAQLRGRVGARVKRAVRPRRG